MGGYRKMEGSLSHAIPLEAKAWTAGAYAAVALPSGLYAQAAGAWLGDVKFDRLGRFSVYGQQPSGRTKGYGWAASGELGWTIPAGLASVTPFAAIDYTNLELDGYTESGASVSNLTFSSREMKKLTTSFGGELAVQWGALRPALRGGYSIERESGDGSTTVKLASAQHAMGSVALPIAKTERDSAFGELRIAMRDGALSGYVAARGRWGRGDDDARVSLGVAYGF